jgi:hypothetical protein
MTCVRTALLGLCALLFAAAGAARAASAPTPVGSQPAKTPAESGPVVQRVGGDYTVAAIERQDDRSFLVEFKAVTPSGRYDTLRLESDHVHVAVKVGQKLRLSAEIMGEKGPVAEVAQVVLFLQGNEGRVPVWLLSTKAPMHDLRATRYLEMHVPANDYLVM